MSWNTDVKSAPRGEDVLIAVRTLGGSGPALTQLGMLLWEPNEREEGDTDDDIEGYWGELNGCMGIWYWNSTDDGTTDKADIVAWQPLPEPYVQQPDLQKSAA